MIPPLPPADRRDLWTIVPACVVFVFTYVGWYFIVFQFFTMDVSESANVVFWFVFVTFPAAALAAAGGALGRYAAHVFGTRQPGWRPDPTGQHVLRYWDGHTWTTHGADTPPPLVPGSR